MQYIPSPFPSHPISEKSKVGLNSCFNYMALCNSLNNTDKNVSELMLEEQILHICINNKIR